MHAIAHLLREVGTTINVGESTNRINGTRDCAHRELGVEIVVELRHLDMMHMFWCLCAAPPVHLGLQRTAQEHESKETAHSRAGGAAAVVTFNMLMLTFLTSQS